MSIGIFDSGLGGLTVARAVMEAMPWQKIIYFGDTARTPYGNKSPETVAEYAVQNAKLLLKKKAKAIVVGCNTASAVSGMKLRKEFPDVPIFEVISPAVREALRVSRSGKIGVIGTRTTIQSGAYQAWLRGCMGKECPLFVPLVEAGRIVHPTTYEVAQQYLEPFRRARIDTLILGCTHYPWLKPVISDIMGRHVTLVDSAETVAKEVAHYFNSSSRPRREPSGEISYHSRRGIPRLRPAGFTRDDAPPAHQFYVSKKTPKFQELAEKWLGMPIKLQIAH